RRSPVVLFLLTVAALLFCSHPNYVPPLSRAPAFHRLPPAVVKIALSSTFAAASISVILFK
ncbi:MAG TPA: hypothetical protein VI685_23490, partial [Candidatus Angelobacter sp.]